MDKKQKKKWRIENKKTIDEIVKWIRTPDKYVPRRDKNSEGVIEMEKEDNQRKYFGKGPYRKIIWRFYLARMGLSIIIEDVADNSNHIDVIM